ncbi:hypothetical protein IGI04_004478 [Brassica rapa subsp. trilocularis]|uniref:RNase H type-1 domain-containing protein n=1 Tax=Brassica rapa subsp. trilocularis TaxID=1813537 RepID=A0ABQ7NB79_BRACM|nr:hypothetical protein IGI04_004478 [Brassica rapa subsp. trilocularis]
MLKTTVTIVTGAHDLSSSIRVESDSSLLINAIKRKEPLSEIHGVLSDIAMLSSHPSFNLSFHWIPRIQNVVADSLAKEALSMVEGVMTLT